MVVVVHEAVGVADPVISLVDVLEGVQEADPVLVALEDGLSFVAPGGNVVDCTGVFYAERAGHNGRTVAEKRANVNSKDLTLRWCLLSLTRKCTQVQTKINERRHRSKQTAY
jgi:hypothetical protein